MKYAPLALAALAGSLALAAAAWFSVAAVTVVVCLLCAVVAAGWPQLMGLRARRSLSVVIFAAGAVAAIGAAIVAEVRSLFFWSAVSLAFGVMLVFVIQVLRGAGRPQRLASTLGACAGVVVTTTAAGWVAGLRYPAGMNGGVDDAGIAQLRVRGLLPFEQWDVLGTTGPGGELSVVSVAAFALAAGTVIACLPVREAVAVPAIVAASVAAAVGSALLWGELTILFTVLLGIAAGVLLASFRRFLIQQGVPAVLISKLAVGSAPVAVMGSLVYFTERLLFV